MFYLLSTLPISKVINVTYPKITAVSCNFQEPTCTSEKMRQVGVTPGLIRSWGSTSKGKQYCSD